MSTQDTIQVVCRFRPQNNQEIAQNGQVIVDFDDNMTAVKSRDSSTYQFDRVFDWNHTQADVFKYSARTIVEDIMNGYNGTIFCYGQTGSGKTYTMMGDEDKGLTPRIVEKIFDTIVASNSDLEFTVKVSFMEIYMERIKDLLNRISC
jgi:kinesin family protein 5